MNNHKNNSGFTLIEMLVTVAIVGILASIALPSFSRMIESNRISTATNELMSNVLLARSEALKRRNKVTICPSSDQQNCNDSSDFSTGWIIFVDCDDDLIPDEALADCGPNNTEEIIKVADGFGSIYMTNQDVKKISFEFSGRISGIASSFDIGADSGPVSKNLALSRVGRVRVTSIHD